MPTLASNRVESPARGAFTSLRGYPERRGEADATARVARHSLESIYTAAHTICKRVITGKASAWLVDRVLAQSSAIQFEAPHVPKTWHLSSRS
jgi:hypothetical protein